MAWVDEVVIRVQAGSGGNGCISFRREKYVPHGGPNGGNGGNGGAVSLVATRDKTSLLDFKYRPKFEGSRGQHGMGSDCDGYRGEPMEIPVPMGTLVYENESGLLLADLVEDGQIYVVAEGGRGGRGNLSYKSSTNRAPRTAEKGQIGAAKELRLELKLIADVGLVGLPNAGKSSFLRSVSRATPKVASYPFTTLEPHLGVVDHKERTFVIADLPGLIEGAAEGVGLGHAFLRHVSRNRILLHLVDATAPVEDILEQVQVIRAELEAYDPQILDRPRILVFTKADLLTAEAQAEKLAQLNEAGLKGHLVSSQTSFGMEGLLDVLSAEASKWALALVLETEPELGVDSDFIPGQNENLSVSNRDDSIWRHV